jgi:hypothetical protein
MTYLQRDWLYIRTEEEETIQRRSSSFHSNSPLIQTHGGGRGGDSTSVECLFSITPHTDAWMRRKITSGECLT